MAGFSWSSSSSSSSSVDKIAMPKVTTPIRPIIMVPMMMSLPSQESSAVTPVESPAVLKAAVDSNNNLRNGRSSVQVSKNTLVNKNKIYRRKVDVAEYKRTTGIRRPKNSTRVFSFKRLYIRAIKLQKTVVFMPPAVPEGEPPTLIRSIKISKEQEDKVPTLTVLYPPVVIAAVDWKKDSNSVRPGVVTNKVKVPKATMQKVHTTIILVVNEMAFVLRRIKLNKSVTTMNPMAPASDKHEITMLMVLLSAKFSKLLFHNENPAVQKAETLLKTLYHAASKIP